VDADYRLTADAPGGNNLTLTLGKRRRQHFAPTVRMRRMDDPLRHEPSALAGSLGMQLASGVTVPVDSAVATVVTELDRFGIDAKPGGQAARDAYYAAGGTHKAGATAWVSAQRFRRDQATWRATASTQKARQKR
jgi:hypothetical protein